MLPARFRKTFTAVPAPGKPAQRRLCAAAVLLMVAGAQAYVTKASASRILVS